MTHGFEGAVRGLGLMLEPMEPLTSLRGYSKIWEQPYEDCVGFAFKQCIYIRSHITTALPFEASGLGLYTLGREVENGLHIELQDEGSVPADVAYAVRAFGCIEVSDWPEDGPVNARVPQNLIEKYYGFRISGVYQVLDTGVVRQQVIQKAIEAGHPLTFSMQVDQAYEDYVGTGVYPGFNGESLGGHEQCIVGYDDDAVIVANSWGTGWGEQGFARIAWQFICSDQVQDIFCVTGGPGE